MNDPRPISKVFKSQPVLEGAGVHLKRAFGFNQVPLFDPFLLLDDFRSNEPSHYLKGFPWHPHRGIETITYMIDGVVEHGDSLGNKGEIAAGDVQWMTAGNGIIHQEMPKGDAAGNMGGFQLWANLPASQKMMPPRYRDVLAAQIPEVILDNGVTIKVICGQVGDTQGPVRDIVIAPQYLDISMPAHTIYKQPTTPGHTVFIYVIRGRGYVCMEKAPFTYDVVGTNYFDMRHEGEVDDGTLVLFGDGDHVVLIAEDHPLRCLLVSGQPLNGPVAWRGPIVMNTQDELREAFEAYQDGTFVQQTQ